MTKLALYDSFEIKIYLAKIKIVRMDEFCDIETVMSYSGSRQS